MPPLDPHLALVTNVAACLLAGTKLPELTDETLTLAAQRAAGLLNACQIRLDYDAAQKERERQNAILKLNQLTETVRLQKQFRDGVPWLKGLLYITKKRSEADAIDPFQRWRASLAAERRLALSAVRPSSGVASQIGPLHEDVQAADLEVEQRRLSNRLEII